MVACNTHFPPASSILVLAILSDEASHNERLLFDMWLRPPRHPRPLPGVRNGSPKSDLISNDTSTQSLRNDLPLYRLGAADELTDGLPDLAGTVLNWVSGSCWRGSFDTFKLIQNRQTRPR